MGAVVGQLGDWQGGLGDGEMGLGWFYKAVLRKVNTFMKRLDRCLTPAYSALWLLSYD